MKYIDADMIESIEMWLHEIEPKWVEKELAWLEELRSRLALIDSLQQEQPEVDLDKEMDKFYGMYRDKTGKTYDVEDDEPCFDWKEDEFSECDMRIARHFYELGLNIRKK